MDPRQSWIWKNGASNRGCRFVRKNGRVVTDFWQNPDCPTPNRPVDRVLPKGLIALNRCAYSWLNHSNSQPQASIAAPKAPAYTGIVNQAFAGGENEPAAQLDPPLPIQPLLRASHHR
jgi:hypothetical protein